MWVEVLVVVMMSTPALFQHQHHKNKQQQQHREGIRLQAHTVLRLCQQEEAI
jgi:hypothetical protein